MKKGFKAKAERKAMSLREALSLSNSAPLIGIHLAKHLEVKVSSTDKIPRIPPEIREQLWEVDNTSWSAFTISDSTGMKWVFYNSTHSRARHESNILHELSHIICKHEPSKFVRFENCDFSLRTCLPEHEEEANWLTGCLKLPRESILWAIRRGMKNNDIADHFVTSLDMVRFRRNVTGVDKQLQRRKRWK